MQPIEQATPPIIDIHCHPATKVNFGSVLTQKHTPLADVLPTGMHVDIPNMQEGNVKVAVSVHYIVERGLIDIDRNPILNFLVNKILGLFDPELLEKVAEDKDNKGVTFRNTLSSIQKFDTAVKKAIEAGFNVSLPKNFAQFDQAWQLGKTIFIHSIEGAHVLGNNETRFIYEANIDQLARAGVCQITIAHFFMNTIVSSQGGIPPHSKKLLRYDEANVPPHPIGLNPVDSMGEKLVNKLLEVGIIIDLVHCPPVARNRIFEINKMRAFAGKSLRPLIFSHTGIQSAIDPSNRPSPMDDDDFHCLPSDAEVLEIIHCGGVIGVIFMNYWLNGKEEDNLLKREKGLDFIVNTMLRLKELGNGSCDHIAIGSDLDGFSQVPDDLNTSADMSRVPIALKNAGFTKSEIDKICFENYLRVLKSGWGENPISILA